MPILQNYTAKIDGTPITGGRAASGEDFGGQIGEGLMSGGRNMQSVGAYVEQQNQDDETRKALVASAELRAKYAKELDEATLSGAPLAPIRERMQADYAKIGENFSTRKGSDAVAVYSANANLMFDEQAGRIEVTRAMATARIDGSKFLNSAAAIIQSNPGYLATAEQDADALASTFSNIPADKRAAIADELKKDLNMAAAVAAARVDPEGTKVRLDKGEWNLSPEQRNMAINRADTEIRAKRADEAYQRSLEKERRQEANDQARDNLFKGIIGGTTRRRDIMDNPDLTPATREHLINVMDSRAKELTGGAPKTDPITERNLWLAINAPDGTPGKIYTAEPIYEAVRAGRMNTDDANRMLSVLANQKDENGRTIGQKLGSLSATVGRALSQDPQFTAQPALVAQIQLDFQARVQKRADDLRKAGKDPTEIFNPDSKEYVGRKEFIQGSIDAARSNATAAGQGVTPGQEMITDGRRWLYKGGDPKNPKNYTDLGPVEGNAKGGAKSGTIRQPQGGGGEGGGGGDRPNTPQGAADYDAIYGGVERRAPGAERRSGQNGLGTRPLNAQEAENEPGVQRILKQRAEEDRRRKGSR